MSDGWAAATTGIVMVIVAGFIIALVLVIAAAGNIHAANYNRCLETLADTDHSALELRSICDGGSAE